MNTFKKSATGISLAMLSLSLIAAESPKSSEEKPTTASAPVVEKKNLKDTKAKKTPPATPSEFFPQWYVGGTLGMSQLEPSVKTAGSSIDDKNDLGLGFYVGYDFAEKISLEGYYFDLGEASVNPDGASEYQVLGVSALYYFYNTQKAQGIQTRKGLSFFARAGLGNLQTGSKGSVDTRTKNNFHLHWGGGLEYALPRNVSLRADIELYDKDAQFLSVSALWRFGGNKTAYLIRQSTLESVGAGSSIPDPIVVKPIIGGSIFNDADKDGVRDEDDACPKTPRGSQVDAVGCFFAGALNGVKFEIDSAKLLPESKILLDGVAQELQKYPRIVVEIQAHTDSTASEAYNLDLSYRRARSVRDYLVSQGVEMRRMVPRGYGESEPIADNRTKQGRKLNRRVEFKILAK